MWYLSQAGISLTDASAAEMSLVRWQPDFIAISYTSKNIAIDTSIPPGPGGTEKLCHCRLWMDNQNHRVGRGCSRSGS